MSIILQIVVFLFLILVLVLFHEYGHYLAARYFGVKVKRFSFGFGKPLYKWHGKKSRVEFVLAPILLGGYVRLADSREDHMKKEDLPLAFDHKPILQRAAIIFAGPLANIILALFAFWIMLVIGFEVQKPIVGKVIPKSLAAAAAIKSGDEIVAVDKHLVRDWKDVVAAIIMRLGDKDSLHFYTQVTPLTTPQLHTIALSAWQVDALEPNPLKDLGIVPYKPLLPSVVGEVAADSPAAFARLEEGDKIVSIADNKLATWDDLITYIQKHPEQTMQLQVLRHNHSLWLTVTSTWKYGKGWNKIGYIGVKSLPVKWPAQMLRKVQYPPLQAFLPALEEIVLQLKFNAVVIAKLVTHKISFRVLGGPITIYQASSQAIQRGLFPFVNFLIAISIMLAFVNLLPLPGLDGGYLILLLVEAILGKPLSLRTQLLIMRLGMILILMLFLQATINDLMRMF